MDSRYFYEIIVVILFMLFAGMPVLLPLLGGRVQAAPGYRRAWHSLAVRQGLIFDPGQTRAGPQVTGTYRGRSLTLNLQPDEGFPPRIYTHILLSLRRPVEGYLAVSEHPRLTQLGKAITAGPGDAGLSAFNRRFAVGSQPAALSARLAASANWQRKLLQAGSVRIDLHEQNVRLRQAGILSEMEQLVFLFDLLNDTARLLEQ